MDQYVDLTFPLVGQQFPLDHGYSLYAAISRAAPELHGLEGIGVHPVRGDPIGDGKLRLTELSKLRLRTPTPQIGHCLSLAGKCLDLDGDRLRVGVPQVFALKPAANLAARLVTIKKFMEPDGFLEAVRRQLSDAGVSDRAKIRIPPSAPDGRNAGQPIRRVLRIKDKTIVGFALHVLGLSAEESVTLQASGVGGRRHMGCGIFVPVRQP